MGASTFLTSDSANYYYKVPVPHGVAMTEGSVSDTCGAIGMKPICWCNEIGHSSYHYNVEGCLHSAGGYVSAINDVSTLLCGHTRINECPDLHGVFTAMKGHSVGECGVMPDRCCADRSGFVSGPGADYSVGSYTSQYYGICGVPRE